MNKAHHSGHHGSFPGRPKKCNSLPATKACQKRRQNNDMLCRHCTAWQNAK